jgi:hypothetical protein
MRGLCAPGFIMKLLSFCTRSLILHYIGYAQTQLAHVQCFVLLASFLCSINALPQAWLLVGQALRTGQDLGLHVSHAPIKYGRISCACIEIASSFGHHYG